MTKWARAARAGLCSAVLLAAGCTASAPSTDRSPDALSSPPANSSPGTGACPVTRPTESAIPGGVRDVRYGPVFGEGALWVGAWWATDPIVNTSAGRLPYGQKFPSFTVQDDEVTGALGPPRVQAKRLDGEGHASGSTGGYATARENGTGRTIHWWPTVINFSSRGCWQVTQTVADTSISYVVQF